jgi:hypothetical protein
MIEIEISETKYPGNPYACQIPRPKVEIFLEGFKELCNKTGMNKVSIGGLKGTGPIPTSLNFDDGTSVGILRMFKEIGFE